MTSEMCGHVGDARGGETGEGDAWRRDGPLLTSHNVVLLVAAAEAVHVLPTLIAHGRLPVVAHLRKRRLALRSADLSRLLSPAPSPHQTSSSQLSKALSSRDGCLPSLDCEGNNRSTTLSAYYPLPTSTPPPVPASKKISWKIELLARARITKAVFPIVVRRDTCSSLHRPCRILPCLSPRPSPVGLGGWEVRGMASESWRRFSQWPSGALLRAPRRWTTA